jgi:hypothetical protein
VPEFGKMQSIMIRYNLPKNWIKEENLKIYQHKKRKEGKNEPLHIVITLYTGGEAGDGTTAQYEDINGWKSNRFLKKKD